MNRDAQLEREVRELRAEVRRLRRLIEGALVLLGIGVVFIFPDLLMPAFVTGVLIPVGFLVSPVGRLIFDFTLQKGSSRARIGPTSAGDQDMVPDNPKDPD